MAKGNRGGRGNRTLSTLKDGAVFNGDKIDFDGDLVYTKNDGSLNKTQRPLVEAWETKRSTNKVEYANAFGYQGSEYGEIRGGRNGVSTPAYYTANKGSVFTHIHPRGNGELGGTFSSTDIRTWSNGNGATIRAVAKEGTYSITKGKNFNARGLIQFATQMDYKYNGVMRKAKRSLDSQVRAGTISVKDANKQLSKEFNNVLISMHNDFLNNQKNFGYNYYLEKR